MSDQTTQSAGEQLLDILELSETESFELENSTESAAVLAATQRELLLETLSEKVDDGVESFCEISHSWKDGSYCDDGQTLERIYKEPFDVDADLRNGDLDGRSPRDGEPAVAEALKMVSEAYLDTHRDTPVQLYRGINTYDGLCEAVSELLQAGGTGVELDLTVLSNFTTEKPIADHYGTLVVETEVNLSQVALAADSLLPVEDADGLDSHDAEVRVFGTPKIRVRSDGLLLPGFTRSVIDAIESPESNSPDHHDIVAGVVTKLAEKSVQLGPDASESVVDWYEVFTGVSPMEAIALREDVDEVLHGSVDSP